MMAAGAETFKSLNSILNPLGLDIKDIRTINIFPFITEDWLTSLNQADRERALRESLDLTIQFFQTYQPETGSVSRNTGHCMYSDESVNGGNKTQFSIQIWNKVLGYFLFYLPSQCIAFVPKSDNLRLSRAEWRPHSVTGLFSMLAVMSCFLHS